MKNIPQTNLIFGLVLAILLLLYFYVALYIWPSGDDYSYAAYGNHSSSYLDAVWGEWFTWNGRYISNFLVLANPIRWFDLSAYRFSIVILLLLFSGTNYWLIKQLFSTNKTLSGIISLSFTLMYFNSIPDVSEGLYWYTATCTYLLGNTFFSVLIGYYHITLKKNKLNTRSLIIILLLQFIITGLNEIAMIYLLIGNIILLVKFFNQPERTLLTVTLFLQIIFSCLVYFAPGNDLRESYFPDNHNLIHTLINGTLNTGRFTFWILISPSTWIMILVLKKLKVRLATITLLPIYYFPAIFFGTVFIACAAPVWGTGMIGQHRTVNFAMYFALIVFIAFFLSSYSTKLHLLLDQLSNKINHFALLLMFSISLTMNNNYITLCEDVFSNKVVKFNQEQQQRVELLESLSAYADTTLFIPKILNRPKSIFIYDITSDPTHWKNHVYMQYYQLDKKGIKIRSSP